MPLPAHLFASDDGHLYDTRDANWSKRPPLRKGYATACESIQTLHEVKACLRAGEFTFPGGYPRFFYTRDGAALSFDSVRARFREVVADFLQNTSTGWRIEGASINWEDSDLMCDHSGARIPAAYAESDEPR